MHPTSPVVSLAVLHGYKNNQCSVQRSKAKLLYKCDRIAYPSHIVQDIALYKYFRSQQTEILFIMIILQRATQQRGGEPTTAATVGIVAGVVGSLAVLLTMARLLSKGSSQGSQGQAAAGPTSNSDRSEARAARQRRRETDPEPLPPYESRAENRRISRNDVSYDAPAAFSLAEQIALTERSNVAPSMQVAATSPRPRNLTQRMAQVQRSINELNRLTSATPAGGYPPHSLEALKIIQLKQNIALMSDAEGNDSRPAGELTKRTSYEALELAAAGPSATRTPNQNTLYARMQEVQRLLAEVDDALSQPASLETSVQIQTLRARIAEIMEPESTAGPSSSTAPSFPESAHFGQPSNVQAEELDGLGPAPAPAVICEPGQSGPGGGRNVVDDVVSSRPKELPPPYETVTGEASDDRGGAGASSVR